MRAAFFDLDKTVIAKGSIPAFGPPFRRGGLVNRRVVVRALIGQLIYLHLGADENRLARIRESMLAVTKGWPRDRVREIVRETLLETVEPLIYKEALELMEAHHQAGDRVYLVSASPEEIVVPLAELLGADGAIASVGEVDGEGRYTGKMAFYASGEGKADAIHALAARAALDLESSSAYSDSATDLPMLDAVGHPVAVNPDRALSKVARERGWEVRQFTKPVRLRNRMTVRTPVLTTGVALAAGAVALWWRSRHMRPNDQLRSERRAGATALGPLRPVGPVGPVGPATEHGVGVARWRAVLANHAL
ncbi:MAG TPA: HAD-IB family hydrolase [Acidimicrobiales bacterium]|nr:HAD-IB family hydrolase [Acidimicrobiales bacterium]